MQDVLKWERDQAYIDRLEEELREGEEQQAQEPEKQQASTIHRGNKFATAQRVGDLWDQDELLITGPETLAGLWLKGTLGMLHGKDGKRKTADTLNLALAVASGGMWGPYQATKDRVCLV